MNKSVIKFTWLFFLGGSMLFSSPNFAQSGKTTPKNPIVPPVPIVPIDSSKKPTNDRVIADLAKYLDSLNATEHFIHSELSFCLRSAATGKILLDHQGNMSLIPASIQKILTTSTSLHTLGPDYTFKTLIQYDGTINKTTGVLDGNIYIKGSGDPSLGSESFKGYEMDTVLKKWASAIKNAGIKKITGSVIGDESIFDYETIPPGWAWEDMESDYCTGTCGLSFNDNMFDIDVAYCNKEICVNARDSVPGLYLHDEITINPDVDFSYVYVMGSPYMNERYVMGYLTPRTKTLSFKSILPDPALFCASQLTQTLKDYGVAVAGIETTVRRTKIKGQILKPSRTTIYVSTSPTLKEIITFTNLVSQNFYAETLLKTLGVDSMHAGTTDRGVQAVGRFYESQNIPMKGMYLTDGSGLSRNNSISPAVLSAMLTTLTKDTTFFRNFYETLPEVEVRQKVYTKPKGKTPPPVLTTIHAKSGYMTRVRSMAGYVVGASGKIYTFTIIVNNHECELMEIYEDLMEVAKHLSNLE